MRTRRTYPTPDLEVDLDPDLAARGVPVWILDIDGVVNALAPYMALTRTETYDPSQPAPVSEADTPQILGAWPEYRKAACPAPYAYDDRDVSLHIAPDLIGRITDLHYRELVEIVWGSAWSTHALVFGKTAGLPVFPAYPIQQSFDLGSVVDKRRMARAVVSTGRPLIWTDDRYGSMRGLELRRHQRALCMRPDARWGLLPADLDRIETFAVAATTAADKRRARQARRAGTTV